MILVTGGTGLVGSHLIVSLVEAGHSVRALKRAGSDLSVFDKFLKATHVVSKVEWIEGDVLDVYSLWEAMQGVDYVYHCAAYISFNPKDELKMYRVNVEGTANVVNMALEVGVKKVCHVSSVAALGRTTSNAFIDEETQWQASNQNSNYAISKYNAEREVWRGIIEGLPAVIVSPAIILGPSTWKSGSSQLFETVWKGLKYYTAGVNGFVDVRDVVIAMRSLLEGPVENERFILSAGNFKYQEIFNSIADQLNKKRAYIAISEWQSGLAWRLAAISSFFSGRKPFITKETARSANGCYYYSNNKVKSAIGISFTPIHETIAHTASVFLEQHSKN